MTTGNDDEPAEDWTAVSPKGRRPRGDSIISEGSSPKTKSTRKNERRRERRKKQQEQQRWLPAQSSGQPSASRRDRKCGKGGRDDGDSDEEEDEKVMGVGGGPSSSGDDALALVLAEYSLADRENYDDPRRKRLRNLRKKLSAIEALSSHPPSELTPDQIAKAARLPHLSAEAEGIERTLRAEAEEREGALRARREADAELNRVRLAEWEALDLGKAVEGFTGGDDEHACPLCSGPIEAATYAIPCRHVFCRACLEESVSSMAQRGLGNPKFCVCPLCRSCMYDPKSGIIRAEPAEAVRKKMRRRKVGCACGDEVALSGLRRHLRECSKAAPGLFGDDRKKRFGHSFQQPRLDPIICEALRVQALNGEKKKRGGSSESIVAATTITQLSSNSFSLPDGYNEEAEIQAAILQSLEG